MALIRFKRGNNPGTPRWWAEFLLWRVTGLCYHGHAKREVAKRGIDTSEWRTWVRGLSACRDGMLAEYYSLFPSGREEWGLPGARRRR